MNLIIIEKKYNIELPEDEVAYVTEMYLKNKIMN